MTDSIKFNNEWLGMDDYIKFSHPNPATFDWYGKESDFKEDKVNNPKHYTKGKQEVIDTIEDAIEDAPNMKAAFLQGQVLKYLFRLWLKENPKEDAEKARWYLTRLIDSL